MMRKPIFVFGISGATWKVIDPLLAGGRLPNLARLVDQGCRAVLQSERTPEDKHYRPQTAWAALATGRPPLENGLTAFYHTADDVVVPNFWDSFEAAGKTVGLFGWPMTWPVKPVRGFVLPCYHARDNSAFPAELSAIQQLDRQRNESARNREAGVAPKLAELTQVARTLMRYGAAPAMLSQLASSMARLLWKREPQLRALTVRQAKARLMVNLFLNLYRRYRPDLASFHSFLVDQVSHRYWRYYQPELFEPAPADVPAELKSAVENAYIQTDRMLGTILAKLDPETIVAVVSEHGMAPEPHPAEVGDWQYLIQGNALAQWLGLQDQLIACPVARWIAYRPRDGTALPLDAAARFRGVKVVDTQRPLFHVYEHAGSEHRAAEIIVKFDIDRSIERYARGDLESLRLDYAGQTLGFTQITRRAARQRSAMHDGQAVLILAGPGIRHGFTLPPASILDVAPTFLKIAGIAAIKPMSGKVLDVFQ